MKTLNNDNKLLLLIDSQIKEDWQHSSIDIGFLHSNVLMPDAPSDTPIMQDSGYFVTDYLINVQNTVSSTVTAVKPIYTTTQIITQLTTSWGCGDTSAHLWATSPATPCTPKAIITFGINTSNPTNFSAFGLPAPEGNSLVTMTALQVATARLSFHLWDNLIASSLVESGGAGANITLNYFSGNSSYSSALTYNTLPNKDIAADQIWLSSTWASNSNSGMVNGGYGFNTMMHEIGHALGLSHPGLYNGSASYASDAEFSQDNRQYTMMSYFGGYDTTTNAWTQDGTYLSYKYSQTPMIYDIAAIQSLYGADTTTRTGDTIYGYNNNFAANDTEKSIFDFSLNAIPLCTIWDAGGSNDALDCSGWNGNQTINLTSGSYSSVRGLNNNVGIAFNTTIERAMGGIGNDKLIGNNADNSLNGGAGTDTMLGGLGNDTYYIDNVGDVVTENVNAGLDTVYATIGYTLTANVENLVLTGSAVINGVGNGLNNQLTGNSANNVLSGYGGVDTMIGGFGNDTYGVNDINDVVIENAGAGTDTVSSVASSYTLGANVENLVLGGTAAINGTGNALNNQLIGNNAENVLSGGAGADTMLGGLGNDTYYIDNVGDVVTENVNAGLDTVYATIGYTLTANVENLVLTGSAVINGVGNGLNNQLTGNSAHNVLSGYGGVDTMIGGFGNDTYGVNDINDVVIENAGAGTDTVVSIASYTLTANVENLVLGGIAAINGAGNGLNNQLTGNSADNVLSGYGGVDTMIGGLGNDIYGVNDINDVVIENAGAGTDTVVSIASYTLTTNVENLVLGGTAAINGTGNALNNQLIGNNADNVLSGGAGADVLYGLGGADRLIGGDGADTLIGGLSRDTYNLVETTAATDTVVLLTGDSLASMGNFDLVNGFKLGSGVISTVGADRLDLVSTTIAANVNAVNGVDSGSILSHHINNGIISFDDINNYIAPVAITTANLANVLDYLQANITGGNTVAFVSEGNTFVFQDGGVTDTLVELVGVTANSVNHTGLATGALWII